MKEEGLRKIGNGGGTKKNQDQEGWQGGDWQRHRLARRWKLSQNETLGAEGFSGETRTLRLMNPGYRGGTNLSFHSARRKTGFDKGEKKRNACQKKFPTGIDDVSKKWEKSTDQAVDKSDAGRPGSSQSGLPKEKIILVRGERVAET